MHVYTILYVSVGFRPDSCTSAVSGSYFQEGSAFPTQEGTGSVRLVSVPDFSKFIGSVRFGSESSFSRFPIRRGSACVLFGRVVAWSLFRFGSFPRPVPAGSLYLYIYIYIYMYYIYIYIYVYIYIIHIYVCVYIYIYRERDVYIYIYVHT